METTVFLIRKNEKEMGNNVEFCLFALNKVIKFNQ